MIRWPRKVPAGRVSNEIVHGVDLFATLANFAGARAPTDRPIDGLDQSDFFLGKIDKSAREGFPIWCGNLLMAAKWQNWKMHFYKQDAMLDPPLRCGIPVIINLLTDPHEEKPTVDTWVVHPMLKMVAVFGESVQKHPLIPMGTPDPYVPSVE